MAAIVLSTSALPTAWTTWTDIEALSNRKLREFILAAGRSVDGLVTKAELKEVAYEIQAEAAEGEGEDEGEGGGEGEGEVDWSECWEAPLSEPFCLHAILGLSPTDEGDVASRVRASFHSRARSAYPSEHIEDATVYALAVRRFRRLCLAFTVLKDDERRRIYMAAGYAGLRSSEAYQETSAFELDAVDTYHAFFEGREAADRDYLLLNGDARADKPPPPSEEELEAGGCDVQLLALWPQAAAASGGGEEGGGEGEEGGGEGEGEGSGEEDGEEEDEEDEEVLAAAASAAAAASSSASGVARRARHEA